MADIILNTDKELARLQKEAARTDAWALEQEELIRLEQLRQITESALACYSQMALDADGEAARDDEGKLLVTPRDIASLVKTSLLISKAMRDVRRGAPFQAAAAAAEAAATKQMADYLGKQ